MVQEVCPETRTFAKKELSFVLQHSSLIQDMVAAMRNVPVACAAFHHSHKVLHIMKSDWSPSTTPPCLNDDFAPHLALPSRQFLHGRHGPGSAGRHAKAIIRLKWNVRNRLRGAFNKARKPINFQWHRILDVEGRPYNHRQLRRLADEALHFGIAQKRASSGGSPDMFCTTLNAWGSLDSAASRCSSSSSKSFESVEDFDPFHKDWPYWSSEAEITEI